MLTFAKGIMFSFLPISGAAAAAGLWKAQSFLSKPLACTLEPVIIFTIPAGQQ
jgi:hypothetical protein